MSCRIFYNKITPFQSLTIKRSKSRKIDIFPKRLTHDLVQKWPFFQLFFFQAIQTMKMSFTIFFNEKTLFQALKTRTPKSRKTDIFPKGLTHGFGPKMVIFPTFFFRAIQVGKESFTIFFNEKTPFQALKTRTPKVEKLTFFQRG